MSTEDIRRALETHLATMPGVPAVAWENAKFTPPSGQPWVQARMIYAEPANEVLGCTRHRERGILQVDVYYPVQNGSSSCQTQSDTIRARFARGTRLTHAGQSVLIDKTPSKATIGADGAWYRVAVSIPYSADVIG